MVMDVQHVSSCGVFVQMQICTQVGGLPARDATTPKSQIPDIHYGSSTRFNATVITQSGWQPEGVMKGSCHVCSWMEFINLSFHSLKSSWPSYCAICCLHSPSERKGRWKGGTREASEGQLSDSHGKGKREPRMRLRTNFPVQEIISE